MFEQRIAPCATLAERGGGAEGPVMRDRLCPVAALLLLFASGCASVSGGLPLPSCSGEWCGFDRPEDIADIPSSSLIAVAGHGGLTLVDTATGLRRAVTRSDGAEACGEGEPGGIALRREGTEVEVARIVRGSRPAIEVVRFDPGSDRPEARPLTCIPVPADYFLNDLAFMDADAIVATHMFDTSAESAERERRLREGIATGHLVVWQRDRGWRERPSLPGVFLNGVDIDPDGSIVVADTYGRNVRLVANDGTVRNQALPMQPDNVTAIGGHRALVAGGTGKPRQSTRNCAALGAEGCAFPAAVLLVDFDAGTIRPLVRSAGRETQGFSVAVAKSDRLWIGSAFSDRLVVARDGDVLP